MAMFHSFFVDQKGFKQLHSKTAKKEEKKG